MASSCPIIISPNPKISLYKPKFTIKSSSSSKTPLPIRIAVSAAASGGLLIAALLSSPPSATAITPLPQISSESIPSPQTLETLKTLLYTNLTNGNDEKALSLLDSLLLLDPSNPEWPLLSARLHSELGHVDTAKEIYESILSKNPLSFEPLFEYSLLLDRTGAGPAAVTLLNSALEKARAEKDSKSEKDVRLLIAQMRFLQKDVDAALGMYEELAREDKMDFRPWFCRGVIYSLMEKNKEAREMFKRCKELVPAKFDVDAYLQSPLSRVKIAGTEN